MADVPDKPERNLRLIKEAAIIDKLQHDLEKAMFTMKIEWIKIWVLTGDKVETGVNIKQTHKQCQFETLYKL